jgi:hypothetical protein
MKESYLASARRWRNIRRRMATGAAAESQRISLAKINMASARRNNAASLAAAMKIRKLWRHQLAKTSAKARKRRNRRKRQRKQLT